MLNREHAKQAIEYLNELLLLDHDAIQKLLIDKSVAVNREIANHPTAQVRTEDLDLIFLSVLGLINGMFGIVGGDGKRRNYGNISAVLEDGKIVRFQITEE